jgi:SAC3/GANP family
VSILACRETGNYARFFRILRQAPYLLACLMTKYVRQMRDIALDTIHDVLVKKDRPTVVDKYKVSKYVKGLKYSKCFYGLCCMHMCVSCLYPCICVTVYGILMSKH